MAEDSMMYNPQYSRSSASAEDIRARARGPSNSSYDSYRDNYYSNYYGHHNNQQQQQKQQSQQYTQNVYTTREASNVYRSQRPEPKITR